MYIGLHVKYSLILSHCNQTRILSTCFRKIRKYQILRKPVQWERSCSARTYGRTDSWTGEWTDGLAEGLRDTTKIFVAFRNFAYAHKICFLNDNTFCSMRRENSLNCNCYGN